MSGFCFVGKMRTEGKMKEKDIKDAVIATVKGAVSNIPIAGSILSEYIGLAQKKIGDKRIREWMELVENRLRILNCDINRLSDNELFFSALHITTEKVIKELQKEKREYFANALYNTVQKTDISEEKKLIFISLLEKYTLSSIKLLRLYSEDNNHPDDNILHGGMMTTHINPGQEKARKYILEYIPEFEGEIDLVQNLAAQLFNDGLIEEVKFDWPEYPEQSRRKRSTKLGDEFIVFISE